MVEVPQEGGRGTPGGWSRYLWRMVEVPREGGRDTLGGWSRYPGRMVEVPRGVPYPLPWGYPLLPCNVLSVSGLRAAGCLTRFWTRMGGIGSMSSALRVGRRIIFAEEDRARGQTPWLPKTPWLPTIGQASIPASIPARFTSSPAAASCCLAWGTWVTRLQRGVREAWNLILLLSKYGRTICSK